MHTTLIFQLLVLLVVANGAPVLVKKALGDQLAQPFDGGAVLPDGRPLFGSSKTVRGVVSSFLATPLVALLMGFQWEVGALVAGGAVAGDLLRRLGFPRSSMALGLDQIPESLFPLAACRLLLPVTLVDILVGVAIFVAGGLILSPILFRLHLRDKPY
jgi:CDP-2,3-bis-(O-geranylgeranyl)-sn-glycerol synthase